MAARTDRWLVLAAACSGASALGYQILWTQLLALALGHETLGVLGVLAGLFGGMAAGAAILHPRIKRARNPARMFTALEWIAAAYAVASPFVLQALARRAPEALGRLAADHSTPAALTLSWGVAALTLLPATFCMGAALPALVEARRRALEDAAEGRGVGRVYAAHTFGAGAGVLLTTYALLPTVNVPTVAAVLAGLGGAGGLMARRWAPEPDLPAYETQASAVDASADPDPDVASEPWLLVFTLGVTGFLGVGLEVVGVQVLAQIFENTIYTFGNTLAVYLIGTSLGAWAYARWVNPATRGRPATALAGMLVAQAVAVVVAAEALARAPWMLDALAEGGSMGAHLRAELVICVAVFGLPTALMGATFSHIGGLLAPNGVGRACAVNLLGSALAPLVFSLHVLPTFGYRESWFVVVYGYVLAFGGFTWFRRFGPKVQVGGTLAVVALTAAAPDSLVLVEPEDGWVALAREETVMGLVVVSEATEATAPKEPPLRRLQVGQHFRMGGAKSFGERRMGHIPLLLHPAPTRALFLGVGTGATVGASLAYPQLQRVDAVELVPAILDQLHFFSGANEGVATADRVTFHAADARRFVAASKDRYDVVVADLFHPGRSAAGGLYTQAHFEAVRARLDDRGLFAQWVPLHQLDLDGLKTIVRTFADVFDPAAAWLGIYNVKTPAIALIGAKRPDSLEADPVRIARAVTSPGYAKLLMQAPGDLLGACLMDRDGLLAFAGDGPRNTDFNPRVMLRAPAVAYRGDPSHGWANLGALLEARTLCPLSPSAPAHWRREATRFAAALDAYLRAEAARADVADLGADWPVRLPASAVDGYLSAYDHPPDFPPPPAMLYVPAAQAPRYAAKIFDRMIARTPNEPRAYHGYLQHLQRSGDSEAFEALRTEAQARFGPRPK